MQASAGFPQDSARNCSTGGSQRRRRQSRDQAGWPAGGWTDTYAAVHGPEDPGFTCHGFLGRDFGEKDPKDKAPGQDRLDLVPGRR